MKRLIWGIKGRITQAAPGLAGGASRGKVAASDKGCRISPGTDPACPGNPTLLGCLCSVSRQGQGGICSPGAVPERLIPPGAAVAALPVPPPPSWQLWELQRASLGQDTWKTSFFSLSIRTAGCVVGAGQPSCGVSICPKCPPPRAALAAAGLHLTPVPSQQPAPTSGHPQG